MPSVKLSFIIALLAMVIALPDVAPAEAGEAHRVGSVTIQSLGAVPAQAKKYFSVNLQPGTTPSEAAAVAQYFRSFGLQGTLTPQNDILFVAGTFGQAAAAAHTTFARVQLQNQTFVHSMAGETYPPLIRRHILATTLEAGPSARAATITLAPAGGYSPADIGSYYNVAPLYKAGLTGSGQNVAVLACANVVPADISTFEAEFNFPVNLPTLVPVDGGATTTDLEPTGDVERIIGTAPLAHVFLYVVPEDCSFGELADGFARIAADAPVKHFAAVTHSYGATEDEYIAYGAYALGKAEHVDLSLLLARSTPVFTVSGDWGASFGSSSQALNDGELTVWYPASDNTVIAVGGTEAVSRSASNPVRDRETAWGDGGGGVSNYFSIPDWQKGVPGIASTTNRNVPDVALAASPGEGYAAVWTPEGGSQSNYWFYGTSFAAPTWAGLIALVEQDRARAKKAALPQLVKTLYALRTTSAFYDITAGCNGYYCAKPGFDNVTGLGVFNGFELERALFAQP